MTANTTSAVAVEQTVAPADLDRARLYLQQTKSEIVGVMRNISDRQWMFRPSPDRWSIAEIVEHIVWVQERVLGRLREKLDGAPEGPVHPDYKRVDDIIIYQFPNRLTKFPTPAQPAGNLSRSQALDRILANYYQLSESLDTTPWLRIRSIESFPLKAVSNGAYEQMDGYQWILAAAAHTERHTKQMLEVMADPDFPA